MRKVDAGDPIVWRYDMLDASKGVGMRALPTGTITFLYTDIEGSTRLWQRAPSLMPEALARHNTLLHDAIEGAGGVVFRTMGDAFCAAFSRTADALAAAEAAQHALLAEPWPEECVIAVRMSVHAGAAEVQDSDYVGHALNRVARLLSAGHGGQVLVSGAAEELVAGQLPADVTLLDLGEHRLKDLVRPERIYQLEASGLPKSFPPLATLDARPTNLPVQMTPFVGREREVEAVAGLARRPEVRLLTLTGPGGTGKTRLALQAGAELVDTFADGVYFVALADITDSAHVPSAIVQALGVKEVPGQDPADTLIAHLGSREMLLILDNFEQIVEAAPAVSRLLAGAPRLTVLVTSRFVLHLSGEHEYAVPPLSLPDPGDLPAPEALSQYDAVALFIERARGVKQDFSVTNENAPAVAEICVRLDGLPLAIELAAARIRIFPPRAILGRLQRRLALLTGGARDLPTRQQTLRGAIDWSYSLLDPEEQRLFARLSVFAGGCTIEAVEAICNLDGDLGIDTLDGISSLAEKSLLRQGDADPSDEPRFYMLETIREYAGEKLAEMGEADAMRERHLRFFLNLARMGQNGMWGEVEDAVSIERLAADYDNLIAALRWAMERDDGAGAQLLTAYLTWFWSSRGLWHEGETWSQASLAMAPPEAFPSERGALLAGFGVLAAITGDTQNGIARISAGRRLLEEAGDRRNSTRALVFEGMFMSTSGDTERGVERLNRALAQARELRDPWAMATAQMALAHAAMEDQDYPLARRHAEESLATLPADRVTYEMAHVTNLLGDISRLEGAHEEARDHYQRALDLTTESGFHGFIPSIRHNLAWASHDLGDDARARELFSASAREFQQMGDERGVAECLVGLGCAVDDPELAVRLFAAGCSSLTRLEKTLSRPNQRDYDRSAARVREALGEEGWDAAWTEGAGLTPDEALALVSAHTSASARE